MKTNTKGLFTWRGATLALCAFCLLFTLTGFAQDKSGDVKVQLIAQKAVTDSHGHESLQNADEAKPGDTIQYTATYKNEGAKAVTHLLATLPIPPNTEFLPDSATPQGAMASVDGKNFAPMPLKRTVKAADGTEKEEAIPYREYRSLRWEIGKLEAGAQVKVTARVKVSAETAGGERK